LTIRSSSSHSSGVRLAKELSLISIKALRMFVFS
jgi:hypothetical protein